MKRKFNKKLLVFCSAIFAVALVSAALISHFGIMTAVVDVEPAITIDGQEEAIITHVIPEEAPGGELFCFLHKLLFPESRHLLYNFYLLFYLQTLNCALRCLRPFFLKIINFINNIITCY